VILSHGSGALGWKQVSVKVAKALRLMVAQHVWNKDRIFSKHPRFHQAHLAAVVDISKVQDVPRV